ncbi:alpha/beta fold hydrolase [Saccharopolyspora sp. 5N708]|uniref:alpha/beta fold hydrolase n=1 Tax=Saccharopolyspora sp. 5N708 TaxID=3457424 RepID=UPI003FD14C80
MDLPKTPANESGDTQPLTVVLVHGFMDDADGWNDVRPGLTERSLPTVTVKLAGMGDRYLEQGPFTLERYTRDVMAEVAKLKTPVVLVGHSMGAQIAELVAGRQPDRVAALALLNPIPLAGVRLPDEQLEPFRNPDLSPEAQRSFRAQLSTRFPDDHLRRLTDVAAQVPMTTITAVAMAWNEGHPDGNEPARFAGPVLLLRGADDPFVTSEIFTSSVAPRFREARMATIPDSGHWPHMENPASVVSAILDFVARDVIAPASGSSSAPSNSWTSAFSDRSESSFADALAPDVRLQASTLSKPVHDRDTIKKIMATVSSTYESLEFVHEARNGTRTYLEWRATAFGGLQMEGITILTRNDAGQIVDIAIHHRPLGAVLEMVKKVGAKLDGVLTPDYYEYRP